MHIRSDRNEADKAALEIDASLFSAGAAPVPAPERWAEDLVAPLDRTSRWLRAGGVSLVALGPPASGRHRRPPLDRPVFQNVVLSDPQAFSSRPGRKHEAGSVPRVPAPEIDGIVLKALREANDTRDEDLSDRELVLERLASAITSTLSGLDRFLPVWQNFSGVR